MPPRIPSSARRALFIRTSVASSSCIGRSLQKFSQSAMLSAEPVANQLAPKTAREIANEIIEKEYREWLMSEDCLKYKLLKDGPNYLTTGREARRRKARGKADRDQGDRADERSRENNLADGKEKGELLKPFPLNPFFLSRPVLSENLKEEVYRRVKEHGWSVTKTSDHFRITIERVGAVVRMKQMERDWLANGKHLVPYYTEKIMKMLPQTNFRRGERPAVHENTNDLPVHSHTTQQIFWPASESRPFNRVDAGNVFKQGLLPADVRIPHPEIVEKVAARRHASHADSIRAMRAALEERRARKAELERKRTQDIITVHEGKKWDFKVQNISAEWVGKNGRSRSGVGHRYGMPHDDRKRGLIKIPTTVP